MGRLRSVSPKLRMHYSLLLGALAVIPACKGVKPHQGRTLAEVPESVDELTTEDPTEPELVSELDPADADVRPDADEDSPQSDGEAEGSDSDEAPFNPECALGTWSGDYDIRSSDDLQALSGYVRVDGRLSIGQGEFQDLRGLECLTEVTGDLIIGFNEGLVSLAGLDNLERVHGALRIGGNPALRLLDGLWQLGHIGGVFSIDTNAELYGIGGLNRLHTVIGGVNIKTNQRLRSLSGLENLQLMGKLTVEDNDALLSLRGLDGVGGVLRSLHIEGNGALFTLDGLGSVDVVAHELVVIDNPQLPNCEAEELRDRLNPDTTEISGNDEVSPCDPCPDNVRTGDISVYDDEDLQGFVGITAYTGYAQIWHVSSLEPLSCLREAGQGLSLLDNNLHDLVGLRSLEVIHGDFRFQSNAGVEDFTGLSSLRAIEGDLHMNHAYDLKSFAGLGALERIGGSLSVESKYVRSLCGLHSVTEVGGYLIVSRINPLRDLRGLDALEKVGDFLRLSYDSNLEGLAGLERLHSIGGYLQIERNDRLTTLRQLETLEFLGADLKIKSNPLLPTCEAEALRDRLRALGWQGEAVIEDNDSTAVCP